MIRALPITYPAIVAVALAAPPSLGQNTGTYHTIDGDWRLRLIADPLDDTPDMYLRKEARAPDGPFAPDIWFQCIDDRKDAWIFFPHDISRVQSTWRAFFTWYWKLIFNNYRPAIDVQIRFGNQPPISQQWRLGRGSGFLWLSFRFLHFAGEFDTFADRLAAVDSLTIIIPTASGETIAAAWDMDGFPDAIQHCP